MSAFVQEHYAIFLTLHLLAMTVGMGGATVSDILFFKFLKDYRISKKEEEVLHVLKDVVLTSIFFIVLTGVVLLFGKPQLLSSGPFLAKAIAASVLIVNGVCLHAFVAPHLVHLNLKGSRRTSRTWNRLAFALGAVSICSWYSVFFIASLKRVLPQDFVFLLSLYLGIVFIGVLTSQIMECVLTKRATNTH